MLLGAQFYSIRDNTTTHDDLRNSFAQMKKIGYDIVQMSAICPIEAEKLKAFSDEFALPIVCTHSPFDRIVNDTDNLIKEHLIYGCPTIGLGAMPAEYQNTKEGLITFIDTLKAPIAKIRDAGLRFAYHNHAFEFNPIDGKLPYDVLIEDLPELDFIIDTYWIKYAGHDFIDYVKKIGSNRIKNVHFKDMLKEPQGEICHCGAGIIDFGPLVRLCDEMGIVNALVEQDNAPDTHDSFGQMKLSYNSLKRYF